MNLLNKLTIKSLKLNKKRTIVTIIGIILSTALIAAVSSLVYSARLSLIEYEKKESGDYHYVFHNLNKEDLKYFTNNRMIEKYYYTNDIGYSKVDSKNEYKPFLFIKGYSKNALESKESNLISGRLPENDSEILLSSHIKTNGRLYYNIGDTLELEIGKRYADEYELHQYNPYIKDEETFVPSYTKKYKVVGIIERLPSKEESYEAPGYTVITKIDEEKDNMDLYVRLTKEGLNNKEELISSILGIKEETFNILVSGNSMPSREELDNAYNDMKNSKYEISSNSYLVRLESSLLEDESVKTLFALALIVIIIIIVTSVFCIKNSFDISITEKTRQYGMLSSIGATKKQIKKNVYFEALVLGLFGIPLGVIFGHLASYILINITNLLLKDSINIKLTFTFSIIAIILSIILAAITIYFSAMRSAKKASLTSPIESIRNSNDIKITSKKVKSPKIVKKLFGVGGDVSYKNIKRNKKKYRTTIVSIVVCVSVFIALSTFINLAFNIVNLTIEGESYNISLSYRGNDINIENQVINEVITMDSIKDYSLTRENDNYRIINPSFSSNYLKVMDLNGEEQKELYIPIKALGDYQYKEYLKKLGLNYDDTKDKGILINTYVSVYYDQENNQTKRMEVDVLTNKKGDTLNGYLSSTSEKDDTKTNLNIEIAEVTNIKPMGIFSTLGYLIVSDEFYDNNLVTEDNHTNNKILYIDSSDPDKLQNDIEKLIDNDNDFNLYNINEDAKAMESLFTLIAIFLYGFITVIALIGITNIFNTITTSMNLRRREFAILRCIGMTKKEFNKMIRLESLMYGVKSLIIGIPIGLILSYIIYKATMNGEFVLSFEPPYLAILISILSVFTLILIIMKYSLNKINKQNIIETIRNENI